MTKRTLVMALTTIVLAGFCAFGMTDAAQSDPGESGLNAGGVSAADAGAPVYPGGHPINGGLVHLTQYSKPSGTVVTFSTPDSFNDVYAYYKHALPSNAETSETTDNPTARIGTFKDVKGDGSQIDIEIQSYPAQSGAPQHTNYTITDTYKT